MIKAWWKSVERRQRVLNMFLLVASKNIQCLEIFAFQLRLHFCIIFFYDAKRYRDVKCWVGKKWRDVTSHRSFLHTCSYWLSRLTFCSRTLPTPLPNVEAEVYYYYLKHFYNIFPLSFLQEHIRRRNKKAFENTCKNQTSLQKNT